MLVALGAVFPDLTYHPWVSEDVSQTNPVEVEPFRMYSCWRCERKCFLALISVLEDKQ